MKNALLVALSLGAATTATVAMAADVTPEQSRQQLVEYFMAKSPNIKFEDYRLGAYNYSADKKAQWEAAEEFPPYLDHIDAGEAL